MRTLASWMLLVVTGAALAAGCSCGGDVHELDDAARGDDAAMRDDTSTDDDASTDDAFTPAEHYFALDSPGVFTVELQRCGEMAGATAMLRVSVLGPSSCDTPGPIDVTADSATHTITVSPLLWREYGRTCTPAGPMYVRDVPVMLEAGTWTVAGIVPPPTLVVDAMSPTTCPAPGTGTLPDGTVCQADCECVPGLSCLAIRGDAVCERQCADPCETLGLGTDYSLSCASGDACTSDPNLGWTCASSTIDECDDTRPCPAGMDCPAVSEGPRQCAWAIALNGAIRHACTTESDCDPGLDCVQRADGIRACEVRCTTSDMACPNNAPHACLTGNWICEWLGE